MSGVFSLSTIDNEPLPFTIVQFGEDKLELLSARIVFSPAGTFTSVSDMRETIDGEATTLLDEVPGTATASSRTEDPKRGSVNNSAPQRDSRCA